MFIWVTKTICLRKTKVRLRVFDPFPNHCVGHLSEVTNLSINTVILVAY
uniref:Uncharacterized protein n=1 Tax=Rhizophora mucronata TaxID=61149 RepID=A0A2P2R0F3_RHIMU